jgi:glucose-1-phosphate adenylyltransferase
VIESGATIRNSVLMGADFYQAEAWQPKPKTSLLGIGRRCHIEGAIIDKNARIGEGVVITPEGKPANADGENYYIRDGVVVVPKGAVIPAGTLI